MQKNGAETQIEARYKYRTKTFDAPEMESIASAYPVSDSKYQDSVW
jgi:hypothetical protein